MGRLVFLFINLKTKQFKLAVDASDAKIGSVLYQEDENNCDRVVCYFQRNWTSIRKLLYNWNGM